MYQFYYSVMKPHYKERIQLCYTDTDSFIYNVFTQDFYRDMKIYFSVYFDTSNYKLDNVFNILLKNKKVPGLFKDELGGEIMSEFIGLRSKLYCIQTESQFIKKAKGVKKSVTRDLTSTDYKNTLFYNKILHKKI